MLGDSNAVTPGDGPDGANHEADSSVATRLMDSETEWVPRSAVGKTHSLLNHSSLLPQRFHFLSSPVPLVPSFSHRVLCVW